MSQHPASVWQVELRPADILFVRGTGWISRQILSATRGPGEPPTMTSHVGLVDTAGTLETAEILEAVSRVRRTTIAAAYAKQAANGGAPGIAIARCESLDAFDISKILAQSRAMEDRMYGWGKLPLQLLDAWTGRLFRMKRTPALFRRFSILEWPICSVHVAESYSRAGVYFGLKDRYAAPDDIHDAITSRRAPGRWTWPLGEELLELPPPPSPA